MSIDAIHRASRYDAFDPTEEPTARPAASPQPRRELPELEHPIRYPAEMFAGSTFAKESGTFERAAPCGREPHVVERSPAQKIEYPQTTPASRSTTPSAGRIYTGSPNEVATRTTTPTPREVVSMIRAKWPELTEQGARTLAAQFAAETGSGKFCFNWNLGNVKAGPNEPHMYLKGVWEVDSPSGATAQVARANGLAHIATPDEIKDNRWACPPGKAIVVFDPPHPQSRFRAYPSLEDGAARWLRHHQAIGAKDPSFLAALNRGDTATVAHALKQAHYYTAGETDYAHSMQAQKSVIDRTLGAGS